MIVEFTSENENVENLSNSESILKEEDEASNLENFRQSRSNLTLDVTNFTHDSNNESSNDVSAIISSSGKDFKYTDQYSYWTLDDDKLVVESPNEAKIITESLLKKKRKKKNQIQKTHFKALVIRL